MSRSTLLKPTHKPIQRYYQALQTYSEQHIRHEGALETAFQRLLADTAQPHGWTLLPKLKLQVEGKNIYPDGTLRDFFNLRRGFWEAKDTDDDLNAEISKKMAKGYPLTNTIFEDTRTAVLYQNGQERNRFDLTQPRQLADLLNDFYAYAEPEIDNFQQAVNEFKERVPELAKGLVEKIADAHKTNKRFQDAFDSFFTLCRQTLNPNIGTAAVDVMLAQHLLTERLIRRVFENQEFTRRNVIAVEVEKVIDALVCLTFNRDTFLRSLDRFYRAIEDAAHGLDDFTEKQHFLNTVYERFFQGYSVKVADTHGIVYTPQAIVDFMCASVAEVPEKEFGLSLGSPGVNILDPCTGTGNFIVNLLRRIPKKDLPRMYREQLFANEVMLLPYYIAALNIEHAYWELTDQYEPFEGLCFVDTLELAEQKGTFKFMTEKNAERVERQKRTPITVIIGNPPYNMGQLNENDNNKNRRYDAIDGRIRDTYAKDSRATLKNKLYDPYVKFLRWATDRLAARDGIVCFVTNNSFVDQIAFDGMRKHLMEDFSRVYHLHLEGNVRHNPTLAGTTYNVFGIQVGVGITVAIKSSKHKRPELLFHRIDKRLRREAKLGWLASKETLRGVEWQDIEPDGSYTWLIPENAADFLSFLPLGSKDAKASANGAEAIFRLFSLGVVTSRDEWAYSFLAIDAGEKMKRLIKNYNSEVFRLSQQDSKPNSLDDFVNDDPGFLKWTDRLKEALESGKIIKYAASQVRQALYRPFCKMHLYFDHLLNQRRYQQHYIFPDSRSEAENRAICLTALGSEKPFMTLLTTTLSDLHLVGAGCGSQCFPFYVYDEDGTNRHENITDWALDQFRTHYGDKKISKWDIFYYVYGLLHHPGYRTKFADNLKRELPRIPLAPNFRAFAAAGKELAALHLDYQKLEPYPLKWLETEGVPLSYRVEDKMRLSKDKTTLRVNSSLTLSGIPPGTFQYRLSNRSALEWVIDQYQVKQDKRSGIRSDPNRADDEEYIVRLLGQVVRVSLETVRIVAALPERFAD
jgi:predicted helicase